MQNTNPSNHEFAVIGLGAFDPSLARRLETVGYPVAPVGCWSNDVLTTVASAGMMMYVCSTRPALPCSDNLEMLVAASKESTKDKKQFVCSSCGATQLRWTGKCPECNEWNTLEEVIVRAPEKGRSLVALPTSGGRPVTLGELAKDDMPRLPLAIAELSRVLGGGIVPGSCVLVGGDPGIGKSTLLLQMAADVAQSTGTVLYVSAEESAHQIARRASRLGIQTEGRFHRSGFLPQ